MPDEFKSLIQSLASEEGKYLALQMACAVSSKQLDAGKPTAEWRLAMTQTMASPPFLGLSDGKLEKGLSECRPLLPDSLYGAQWEKIQKSPESGLSEPELLFLSSIATDPALAFTTWSRLGLGGTSVRSRVIGLDRLRRGLDGEAPIPNRAPRNSWFGKNTSAIFWPVPRSPRFLARR